MEKFVLIYLENDPIQGQQVCDLDIYDSLSLVWNLVHSHRDSVLSEIDSHKSEYPNGVLHNEIVEDYDSLSIKDANGYEFRWIVKSINI